MQRLHSHILTEVEWKLRVVASFSVGHQVNLVLAAQLLKALFGAPVLTHTAERQYNDQSPHQPEPWKKPYTCDKTHSAQCYKCNTGKCARAQSTASQVRELDPRHSSRSFTTKLRGGGVWPECHV